MRMATRPPPSVKPQNPQLETHHLSTELSSPLRGRKSNCDSFLQFLQARGLLPRLSEKLFAAMGAVTVPRHCVQAVASSSREEHKGALGVESQLVV